MASIGEQGAFDMCTAADFADVLKEIELVEVPAVVPEGSKLLPNHVPHFEGTITTGEPRIQRAAKWALHHVPGNVLNP